MTLPKTGRWENKGKKGRREQMKRLFLLEDDLSLINGLSFALKKQDYEITVARTTLEADALWEKEEYDLAVLDVSLPDGSGFDFCKKNKADIKNAHYVPHCR